MLESPMAHLHTPTIAGDLVSVQALLSSEVDTAVDAWLSTRWEGRMPIGRGYHLDVAGAVTMDRRARLNMARKGARPAEQVGAVRTVVLLATAQRM